MASPLADIDWDNLQGAEVTTSVRLLCLATQERYIIGTTDWPGGVGVGYYNEYPMYEPPLNNPKYAQPFDALANSVQLNNMIDAMASVYRDKVRIDEYAAGKVLTSAPPTSTELIYLRLSSPADDPVTYHNRLFELASIPGTDGSQYPDLSTLSGTEIKKWYDLITQFKWLERGRYKNGSGTVYESDGPGADVTLNGIFDPSERGLVGERNDNMSSGEDYETYPSELLTEYPTFKADHDALWGTYGTHNRNWSQKDYDVILPDSGLGGSQIPPRTPPELGVIYHLKLADDRIRVQAHIPKIIYDFSTWRATYGIGLPQDQIQLRQVYQLGELDASAEVAFPVQPFVEKEISAPTLTVGKAGDIWEIVIHNDEVVLPVLPATWAGLSADKFEYKIRFWYPFGTFFNFDAEDGFVYYS